MGSYPLSPASSFGGRAPLERFTDVSVSMACPQGCIAPAEIQQVFAPDYSRCQGSLPADGMYMPHLQELTPPSRYPKPDACAVRAYGAEQGRDGLSSYTYPPYTPEMSPKVTAAAEDVMTTHSGMNIAKRLRSAESHRIKPVGVEKRRRSGKNGAKSGSVKKHIPLDKPLSEIMRKTGSVQAFDVFKHVHRDNSVRKEEALKEGKVKRPLNAFLLYRKHVICYVKTALLSTENKNNQQLVSRICGDSWKMETDDVKTKFKKLAQAEKTRHAQAFPKYKYTPKQGKKADGDESRRVERSRSVCSVMRPPALYTSSPSMAGASHYGLGMRSQTARTEAIAQHVPYGDDTYCYSSEVPPLASLYGSQYPGQQGVSVKLEPGHGWGQEMAPVSHWAPESHSQVGLSVGGHVRGTSNASAQLYIDPSMLPGTPEAAYQWLHRQDGLHDHHECPICGEMPDGIMNVMPDLDVSGAHNAYLRGGQEDWHVEPVDDTGHFSDWMAQEETAET